VYLRDFRSIEFSVANEKTNMKTTTALGEMEVSMAAGGGCCPARLRVAGSGTSIETAFYVK
jgi:hypothetical protein